MANYYAIERTDEYLAHYGIKGMKWGVRRALERGDRAALGRHYKKAVMKLAKLSLNANRDVSRQRYETAKKRMAAGAIESAVGSAGLTAGLNASRGIPAGDILKPTAVAAGAGALGGALLNSKGIMAGRHVSDRGHARAVAKRDRWAKEMNDTFKNSGITSQKELNRFSQQISALSNVKNPVGYVQKMASKSARQTVKAAAKSPRTFDQLSAKDQHRVAQGMAKLQNRFEGHYQQGLSRGMNHVQAEAYANRQLNSSQPKKRRR